MEKWKTLENIDTSLSTKIKHVKQTGNMSKYGNSWKQ